MVKSSCSNSSKWLRAVDRFESRVLPTAIDYEIAEIALSEAIEEGSEAVVHNARREVLRRGMQLASAIQNFVDYTLDAAGFSSKSVLIERLDQLTWFEPGGDLRACFWRLNAAANVEKHSGRKSDRIIRDENDVLVVGAGFGVDGFGVGKFGGEELLLNSSDGKTYKFIGDAAAALLAGARYLTEAGYPPELPSHPILGVDLSS